MPCLQFVIALTDINIKIMLLNNDLIVKNVGIYISK